MNKIFKVKWNAACQRYDVTSELAKGKSKSSATLNKRSGISLSALKLASVCISFSTCSAMAEEISVDVFNPRDGGYVQLITRKDLLKDSGWGSIAAGLTGSEIMTLGEAYRRGLLSGDGVSSIPDGYLKTGQLIGYDHYDKHTGNISTFKGYDNNQLGMKNISGIPIPIYNAVGSDGQYVDRNLINVQSGGELNVSVGNQTGSQWFNDVSNRLKAYLKGSKNSSFISSVFKASSDNVASKATINYDSKTVVNLGNFTNKATLASEPIATIPNEFSGDFDSSLGPQSVNSIDDLKAYNSNLISAVKSGDLAPGLYISEFNKAIKKTIKYVYQDYQTPINDDDAVLQKIDSARVAFLLGQGAGAEINIDNDASIQGVNTDISIVNVTDGATLNNAGALGHVASSSRGTTVVRTVNATVNNSGVIDAGTNQEMADYSADLSPGGKTNVNTGHNLAVYASGSAVNNTGVINIAPNGSYAINSGVDLTSGSSMINDGNINVAAINRTSNATNSGIFTIGVRVSGLSDFVNNGILYLGREAQRTVTSSSADIEASSPDSRLVHVDAGTFVNSGDLIIGSKTQGGFAALARGSSSSVLNKGNIVIDGRVNTSAPLQNVGLAATEGATDVINGATGVIGLKGINAVAMKALSKTTDRTGAAVRNEGNIAVETGVDPVSGTANYGLWSEGRGASATNAGTITLGGERAIAAHARNGGQLVIDSAATVSFGDINQIGYYVFGSGSGITDNSNTRQSVITAGSTLYRIDGGASFDGAGRATNVGVDGAGATGLLVTGAQGASSTLNTGNMTIDVTGADATGIRVAGSASGELSADTTLSLSGAGSSAGIVDGNYTDITGSTSYVGGALLTSNASLSSANAAAGAVGYIARNGGVLNHQGSINFSAPDTTGVKVDGGTLSNSGSVRVNGIAVDIEGANSVVSNSGTVEATDGTAAFRVGSGSDLNLNGSGFVLAAGSAHGVLLDKGATGLTVEGASIDMAAGGTGSAIENAAELQGIQLKDTTINVGDGAGVRTAASLANENSGTITVSGSGTGIYFGHADSSLSDTDFNTADSQSLVINVDSATGSGVVTNTTGDVRSGVSVNVHDAAGGAALQVKGQTRHVEQSGNLTSQSLTSAVVDVANGYLTSFINKGTIQAAGSLYDAFRVSAGSNLSFTNARGGHITGRVALSDGNNSVTLEGGSTADDVITGRGSDNFYLNGIRPADTGLFSSLQAGTGNDTLNLNDAILNVAAPAMLTGFEQVSLANGSELTLDNTLLALGDAQDDAAGTGFSLSDDSTLRIRATGDTAFNSFIRGGGTLSAGADGHAFHFTGNNAAAAGRDFTGTLALTDATFALGGLNAQALTASRLLAGAGSTVSVADGVQRTGGLAFDGGTVAFNTGTPGESAAKSSVQTANLLDLSGSGTVQVNAGTVDNAPVLPPDTLPLMAQDDANTLLKLAGSDGAVTGSGGNLVLKDQNGNVISDALHTQITQNGLAVANATYDYRLTGGAAQDGLYVSYGLAQLDLLTQGNDALVLNAAGQTGSAADMSAKLTGGGDLAIDTGAGQIVSLSNLNNDYRGKTEVRSGTLQMGNDNVLGQTRELALASGAGFDMNGHRQTVGALNAASGSAVSIADGALDITGGGTVDGSLQGAGALNVTGGTLTVNGSNSALSAVTSIAAGAAAQLNQTSGLGTGSIINDGLLALKQATGDLVNSLSGAGETQVAGAGDVRLTGDNSGFTGRFTTDADSALTVTGQRSLGSASVSNAGTLNLASMDSWTLGNSITGSGALNQNGSGVVTLTQAAAQYGGDTNVNAGGLQLGESGSDVTLASGSLNIAAGATAGGFGGTAGSVNNQGMLTLGSLKPVTRAVADALTFSIGGSLRNSGDVVLGRPGGTAGNLLHVAGSYAGDNGHLTFNTALGDDSSFTDRMVVDGDTSGLTRVSVNNAGGSGAKTLNGIELIHVNGRSDGEFVQEGRIVAGAYDYHLQRGEGGSAGNWYLSNTLSNGGEGEGGNLPEPEEVRVYRPESGAYASNMAAGNTLFNTRLHDRLGETNYVDAITGEEKVTSMWLRNVGGHTRSTDSSGQMKTQANRYVMQLGGDVAQWSSDGADRYHLGVMAGYANQQSNSRNRLTGQKADGSIRGYSAGLYGTWLQDNDQKTGAYVDTWAQYSWFDNTVKGDSLATESYKSKGITASVESGYTWKLGERNERESYYVQPKAQMTWMGVEADRIREANGTRVEGTGAGNVQARVGVRAFIKGHNSIDDGKKRTFEPFLEANWIGNTKSFGSRLNGVTVTQKGTRNVGELKVGVEGQIKPGVNLWGNIGQQMGGGGYSDTSALLGVKVSF
ncbi:autotransporter outer membrane beta-barrel domain-containing protein [Pantoea sp. DY-15]|uniref:autotransporter outer membrane beta-barrel domain-containing protein n=1 Tax=Pantoea sp. DY-15 TaxID=2871489 RepID=UPI001C9693D0|nr:autotransporter outer membrane beta-barrel domain-containing protein [Pantoea sp. DY-15]MBY4888829.1 autotransporter outer membrane beta-barrel domain-containing protein [Pantoea sp. DY-15]